jgi:hypothetical protein
LAEQAGVSPALVSRKLKQGRTREQILTEAAERRERMGIVLTPGVNKPARRKLPDEQFVDAQRRKESALADLRELELAEKRGELLNASEVSTAIHELISTAKSKLLLLGDELGDRLAAESDPIRCREMVNAEVRSALTALSKYKAA